MNLHRVRDNELHMALIMIEMVEALISVSKLLALSINKHHNKVPLDHFGFNHLPRTVIRVIAKL